jgi:hypothetical protein
MSVVLSFIGGLLTVSTVEAARVCNGPNLLIAYPTGAWLVFNLVGGAFVWQLAIVPAFFHRSREIIAARKRGPGELAGPADPNFGEAMRHLTKEAEIVAIPIAVALGYGLPSLFMLGYDTPATILVWLFFPVWVTLVRQLVRKAMLWPADRYHSSFHLESDVVALAGMYAVPIFFSVVSHALLFLDIMWPDDRKEMTRATTKFVVIDMFFIGLTVLYWVFVEAGWRVTLVMIVASVVLGPGAGVCLGWIYREHKVDPDRSVIAVAVGGRRSSGGSSLSEDTPLLR